MRDTPSAADLLDIARRTLLEELLPELPPEHRYTALMVAAAIAITGREIAAGEAWLEAGTNALADMLEDSPPDASPAELYREFAIGLRRGDFDAAGPARKAAYRVLKETTLARLAECSPDYPADR